MLMDPPLLAPLPHPDPPATRPAAEDRRLRRLRAELRARDREIRELRDRLRSIQSSDAWAIVRTLEQCRQAFAPIGTRRDRLVSRFVRGLRRLKKLAAAVKRTPARLRDRSRRPTIAGPIATGRHAVVCLPVIDWDFRFQRPQQLMRCFAREGHAVLYAANRFHSGHDVRLRPIEANVHEVILPGDPAATIYRDALADADRARMLNAMARLASDRGLTDAVVVIQHPYWTPMAEALRDRLGWSVVYDCLDDHSGFWENAPEILAIERRLIATADLVVASSRRLHDGIRARARASVLIRNGCEFEHFARIGSSPRSGPPTIGYYGAIADWFDARLMARLAALRPDWRFELIGSTLDGDVRALEGLGNVRLLGECPYPELPDRIAGWDAFVIPFRRLPLTEATNPVKVYEMLATGRPVVAVGLPELRPIARRGLIQLAGTPRAFAEAIERALAEDDPTLAEARRGFARRNTWSDRHYELAGAIESLTSRTPS